MLLAIWYPDQRFKQLPPEVPIDVSTTLPKPSKTKTLNVYHLVPQYDTRITSITLDWFTLSSVSIFSPHKITILLPINRQTTHELTLIRMVQAPALRPSHLISSYHKWSETYHIHLSQLKRKIQTSSIDPRHQLHAFQMRLFVSSLMSGSDHLQRLNPLHNYQVVHSHTVVSDDHQSSYSTSASASSHQHDMRAYQHEA